MHHTIQNADVLTVSTLRTDALALAEEGYAAIDVGTTLARTIRVEGNELYVRDQNYPLTARRVYFIGIGKCAFAAAEALERILGERLTSGIAFDIASPEECHLAKIETYVGTHPLPSEINVQATKRIMAFLAERSTDDLVIMLISGGGSTLLCSPIAPMTCLDESTLFTELTSRGATIQDINIVRKHISQARGGALAAAAYPAEVIALIVSDVPGNDFGFIASGPTVLDLSTAADAKAIFAKYGIASSSTIGFTETPKEQKYFERVTNFLLLSSRDALVAMEEEAIRRGYAVRIVDDRFDGEARETGRAIVEELHRTPAKTALLYAGESTVTLGENAGKGGRNQEMALATLTDLREDELILPFASDGRDNTDHAGAIADADTLVHAKERNLSVTDYLDMHRSYDFFTTTNDALITGYTGSNVSDLIIALRK